MNELKDKWIQDIRNRMEDHLEPLPADMWEKIEADIPSPKVVPMWKKWYPAAVAAASVILVSTLSVYLFENYLDKESLKVVNEMSPVMEKMVVLPEKEDTALADSKPVVVKGHHETPKLDFKEVQKTYSENLDMDDDALDEVISKENKQENVILQEIVKTEETSDEKEVVAQKRIDMMKADRETQRRNASYLAMTDRKHERDGHGGLQFGISAGNTPYNSSSNFNGISRLMSRKIIPQANDFVISESSDGKVTYSQVLFNNRDKQTYTNVKHHMPVTVGASVKWNINEDWGLESGVSYTYLYSELQSGANSYVEDKQRLHYIGVPLKLHRSIWGNKLFSVYASAGGMVEKCISGDIETKCVDGSRGKSFEKESIDTKPWQFSVSASLGAQVKLLKLLSLYVEPGMAYYFDDGSELLTIRKDKPFNFNLQFGLRFNIGN